MKFLNKQIPALLILICLNLPFASSAQDESIQIPQNSPLTIEAIFQLIENHTNYQFVYRPNPRFEKQTVLIDQQHIPVKDLLEVGLSNTNYTYDFSDQTIVVRKRVVSEKNLRTIIGKISYLNKPIQDVHILIKKKKKGTKTNVNGYFKVNAEIGDIITVSHIGFQTLNIVVEDITQTLNITLSEKTNPLEETVIRVAKPKEMSITEKLDREIQTANGKINPMLFPSKVHYFEGKNLNHYISLTEALRGKISGDIPQIFDVDGQIYYDDTFIPMAQIIDIYIITGSAGTMRWGGPFVIVRTTESPEEKQKRREAVAEQYRNQNYYNNDAIVDTTKTLAPSQALSKAKNTMRMVTGRITHLDAPMPSVHIQVKNSPRGTKTDEKGQYSIHTKPGEILQFSHVGFKSISVVIEDITAELNIEMLDASNTLDEVVITAKTIEGATIKRAKKAEQSFNTSRGTYDPKTAGYAIGYLDGSEIKPMYSDIKSALVGKISGYFVNNADGKAYMRSSNNSITLKRPVAWEVDGVFTAEEPIGLDINQVKSVHALKSLAATTKYGTLGAGGVIVITTTNGDFNIETVTRNNIAEQYRNQSFYNDDAIAFDRNSDNQNAYTEELQKLNNLQDAFDYYDQVLKPTIKDYSTHISIAYLFATFYNNANLAAEILKELSETHSYNPEVLKAIAFQLQAMEAKYDAVKLYQKVFMLRPQYGQSYRDLANAYIENDQFKQGWRTYMRYLMQGHDAYDEGIGQIIYNEMEYLYFNRQPQTRIKESFEPKSKNREAFKDDIRMVFEWNTSEAEFDLEFVAPDRRAYIFEHTLTANEDMITKEKLSGYSSKEFFIDDIGSGIWLVNLTYKGNKKTVPTYFKVTTYYHWGTSNQKKEVNVFNLKDQRQKIQLFNFNKQLLIAFN